ncbi:hypothetical protein ERO13_A03G000015v2 [Gossypium hirsutum]|uniref:ATP-dependent 6-phosphofructokinase 2 n=2 Tax=Gossypium TaxID=3633 RepID=A0A1U8MXW3_GOSHI|nr:ATP-dependent 6-phosphofructokinase 2-like [Gossypium hirsutum]KAG4206226.1 hypothetical protein ERO13_A03G000015v2 [Gossypium hirsutum]TYI34321.1 hypothetical protein ES332_A03G001200v1 [Gossypium tomentosum]
MHCWHRKGETVLRTSTVVFDLTKIVDAVENHVFNQVYIIGEDGTMRSVVKIFEESQRRKPKVGVTGISKTVDNDVSIIDRSFGFQTAVEMIEQVIHVARSYEWNRRSEANGWKQYTQFCQVPG